MEKYIIKNYSDIDPQHALDLVGHVINEGKISGKNDDQYCYAISFNKHTVSCKKNKGESFTFTVTDN